MNLFDWGLPKLHCSQKIFSPATGRQTVQAEAFFGNSKAISWSCHRQDCPASLDPTESHFLLFIRHTCSLFTVSAIYLCRSCFSKSLAPHLNTGLGCRVTRKKSISCLHLQMEEWRSHRVWWLPRLRKRFRYRVAILSTSLPITPNFLSEEKGIVSTGQQLIHKKMKQKLLFMD